MLSLIVTKSVSNPKIYILPQNFLNFPLIHFFDVSLHIYISVQT
jgi:hypothetical protein